MSLHTEINFEAEICSTLAAQGWLYSTDDVDYHRQLALFPEDAIAFVQDTQPEAWEEPS